MVTDFEPFVADPAEPPPPQRLQRLSGTLAGIIVLLLLGVVVVTVLRAQRQDPALQGPVPAATQPPAVPEGSPPPTGG